MTARFGRFAAMLCLLLAPAISGCYPAVAHGPRVEDGYGLTVLAGAGIEPGARGGGARGAVMPNVGLGIKRGWRSANADGGAMMVSLHLPAGLLVEPLQMVQGDIYYQLPRSAISGIDAGLGLYGSYGFGMPYLQAGQIGEQGSGWYTTQGVLVGRENQLGPGGNFTVGWMPSIAYQSRRDKATLHYFASAVVGTKAANQYYSISANGTALTFGVIAVLNRNR